ncbi:MAG: sugar transferase [Solirubrobacteraceae bacterium]
MSDRPTSVIVKPALEPEGAPVWDLLPGLNRGSDATSSRIALLRDSFFRRSLALGDVVAAYLALMLSLVIDGGGTIRARPAALLLAPFIVLLGKILGLYDRDQYLVRKTTIDEAPALLQLSIFYALGVWLAEGLVLRGALGRPGVFALAAAGFVLIVLCRKFVRALALRFTPPERCVLVGSAADADRIASKLTSSSGVNASLIGRVALGDNGPQATPCTVAKLGESHALASLIRQHGAERVIVAPGDHDQDEILECIRLVKALGVKVSVLPRLLEAVGSSSVFDDLAGITLLGVRQHGLSTSSSFLKRVMDIVGAALGLVALAPLLVLLALAISLDSKGSPLFRQRRIGRGGQRFGMLKFRSMVHGADEAKEQIRGLNEVEGGLFKISDDPRITRLGRFLRRTSLDELPQLVNVLKGDMSLVGPRPLVQDEDVLIEGWGRRRLAVKPGMTGLWQIFGSSRIPMPEMVKIDYLYGANWSLWLDLKILIRTVPYVLGRRGI